MIRLFDESGCAAILPESLEGIRATLRMLSRQELSAEAYRGRRDKPRAAARDIPGVAVIPVQGPITKGESLFSLLFGGASLEGIVRMAAEAADDPDVSTIVLDVDSPGGAVFGVYEAAEAIAAINKRKPVVAYTEGLMASAAYWLASAAGRIVASPSAEVGGIGVYVVHLDESEALAKAGIQPTLIRAGEHKAEGLPEFPLSAEAKQALQARVDSKYRLFTRSVSKGRSAAKGMTISVETVRGETFGGGRVLSADEAVRVGMADEVGMFADVIKGVPRTTAARPASARAECERLQATYELELELAGL